MHDSCCCIIVSESSLPASFKTCSICHDYRWHGHRRCTVNDYFEYSTECEMPASWWIIFTLERHRYSMCSKKPWLCENTVWLMRERVLCWNGYGVFYMRDWVSEGEKEQRRSLPCVRSWRVLTSSRTRSCRTCCRMCCLWDSCMMPIRSSFRSVSLIRARPEETKRGCRLRAGDAPRGCRWSVYASGWAECGNKQKECSLKIDKREPFKAAALVLE